MEDPPTPQARKPNLPTPLYPKPLAGLPENQYLFGAAHPHALRVAPKQLRPLPPVKLAEPDCPLCSAP